VCRRGMAKNMRTDRLTLVTLTPYLARVALEDRATLGMHFVGATGDTLRFELRTA
jgi:hypothetical protein